MSPQTDRKHHVSGVSRVTWVHVPSRPGAVTNRLVSGSRVRVQLQQLQLHNGRTVTGPCTTLSQPRLRIAISLTLELRRLQ